MTKKKKVTVKAKDKTYTYKYRKETLPAYFNLDNPRENKIWSEVVKWMKRTGRGKSELVRRALEYYFGISGD